MTTILWTIAILMAFLTFSLPSFYLTTYHRMYPRRCRIIQAHWGGHIWYWNNHDETWSLFSDQATVFSTANYAQQAIGMAETCMPAEAVLAEAEIKTVTIMTQRAI